MPICSPERKGEYGAVSKNSMRTVRNAEALPLLLTLSSGVQGFTTIHAATARPALLRLRFICQLADHVELGAELVDPVDRGPQRHRGDPPSAMGGRRSRSRFGVDQLAQDGRSGAIPQLRSKL